INTLTEKQMGRLAETVELRQYPADARLFHEGDQDSYAVFLLKGKVDILTKGKVEETIESGSFPARYQLAPGH
ncbi:MAG: hypothetical protein GWN58_31695, partial [Anaerolineae bacterium]|nr:hypothetical protein [Anaerolineae bacterium]